jgi:hypothetical protein
VIEQNQRQSTPVVPLERLKHRKMVLSPQALVKNLASALALRLELFPQMLVPTLTQNPPWMFQGMDLQLQRLSPREGSPLELPELSCQSRLWNPASLFLFPEPQPSG